MKPYNFIEDVVSEVAGQDVVPLVKVLKNKCNVSEFKLADCIKCEINATRNMLYRLYDYNLVSFIRKKDKKKGWYIYYWTFNEKRAKDLLSDIKKKRYEKLLERLNREKTTQFFICPNKCMRLDFEQSHDFNFKCPECGCLLDLDNNSELIKELEAQAELLDKELKEMSKPVAKKLVKKPAVKPVKPKKIVKNNVKKIVKKSVVKKPLKIKKPVKKKKR